MIRYSKSGSSDIAAKIRHQTPLRLHRLKHRNAAQGLSLRAIKGARIESVSVAEIKAEL